MAYLDIAGLKLRTPMPDEDVDALPVQFVLERLSVGSSEIDGKLRKRYAAPFAEPVPPIIVGWLSDIVTPELYLRRGWNPGNEQEATIVAAAERARAQMQEAADSAEGLWDLPLRADTTAEGVSKGGPLGYSETSPYDWRDAQAEAIRGRY